MYHECSEADVGYRRLWLNVILRAVEDARGQDLMVDDERFLSGIEKRAREWLGEPSFDLKLICEWAGVEYEKLVEKYGGKYGTSGSTRNGETQNERRSSRPTDSERLLCVGGAGTDGEGKLVETN